MKQNHRNNKRSSRAWAISDRSGMRFRMSEMITEPGTHYFIHRSESDGIWNYVDHPQAHIDKYASFGDPFPIPNARPDVNWVTDCFITDTAGNILCDQNNEGIDIGNNEEFDGDNGVPSG